MGFEFERCELKYFKSRSLKREGRSNKEVTKSDTVEEGKAQPKIDANYQKYFLLIFLLLIFFFVSRGF